MHIPAIMSPTSLSSCSIPLSLYNNNKTPLFKTSTFLTTPTQTLFSFKDDSFVENSSDSPATKSPLPSSDVGLSSELDDKDIELEGRGLRKSLKRSLILWSCKLKMCLINMLGMLVLQGAIGKHISILKLFLKSLKGRVWFKRLRLIYNLLQEELPSGLHVLSIVAKTPSEVNEG